MPAPLPDLTPYLERYEVLVRETDALFERIRSQYPTLVTCREGCSSCCHAVFDLSVVEALYLNRQFASHIKDGRLRFTIMDRAGVVDRRLAKLKRKAFKDSQAGKDSNIILQEMAAVSVPCPLLDADNRCLLYAYRPLTCRLYGVPTAIGGKAHTCGKTGFVAGTAYPTVALDKIQARLHELSIAMVQGIGSAFTALPDVFVPVSTALLTEYNGVYLGTEKEQQGKAKK